MKKRKTIKQKILEKEEQVKEKALKREQDKKLQDEVKSFANTSLHMYILVILRIWLS